MEKDEIATEEYDPEDEDPFLRESALIITDMIRITEGLTQVH